ncbi:HigA family addiction module antitoxin [Jiella marina]|uniref:HigA family addiction module antitoxin n=1 Tax=Jiella sp. LLJ827 TaxID=2917712 RepID=UPI002101A006|nr:HigA family addiction module antitoxin [Jiella sp. LLJ827]MCQ0986795.1 HigA family addiction module antitoxin [Jiella sp. LLJ827]
MIPYKLTAGKLAKALKVNRDRIEKLSREQIGVSADTALRLGKYFGTTAELWLGLQSDWDLRMAQESADLSGIDPIAA